MARRIHSEHSARGPGGPNPRRLAAVAPRRGRLQHRNRSGHRTPGRSRPRRPRDRRGESDGEGERHQHVTAAMTITTPPATTTSALTSPVRSSAAPGRDSPAAGPSTVQEIAAEIVARTDRTKDSLSRNQIMRTYRIGASKAKDVLAAV